MKIPEQLHDGPSFRISSQDSPDPPPALLSVLPLFPLPILPSSPHPLSPPGLRATQKVQHPVSRQRALPRVSARRAQVTVYAVAKGSGPMRVIISGAPASGKGTQCETIVEKVS